MAHLVWHVLASPHRERTKLLNQKYIGGRTFYDAAPKPLDSLLWKAMLMIKHVILSNMKWVMGGGSSVSTFEDI